MFHQDCRLDRLDIVGGCETLDAMLRVEKLALLKLELARFGSCTRTEERLVISYAPGPSAGGVSPSSAPLPRCDVDSNEDAYLRVECSTDVSRVP